MADLPYVLTAEHPAWQPAHDRRADLRHDPSALVRLWNRPGSRLLVAGQGRVRVRPDDARRPALLPTMLAPDGDRVFLGTLGGEGVFAVRSSSAPPTRPTASSSAEVRPVREVAATAPAGEVGLVVHAHALIAWHEAHPRCPRCGAATVVVNGGYARRCSTDGSLHFPRTDPAMIVLVLDDVGPTAEQRCLLARAAAWPAGRMSCLAGFVEPAESVEDAVVREVAEEVGIGVSTVRYAGSQPWPFPASLMLACYALAATHDVRPDGEEIVDARWFCRHELLAAVSDGSVVLPPRLSVARRLIEGWVGHEIPGEGVWRAG